MTAFLLDHLPTLSGFLSHLSLVTVTGCTGLLAATLSTLFGARRAILAAQAAASTLFLVHFLGLGAQTGMVMCLLGLVQITVRWAERPTRGASALYGLTVPAALAVAALTWQGPMSALSAGGFLLATLGRWQGADGPMRLFFLSATVAGAGHNALAGSTFGLVSDALAISGHGWCLWRIHAGRSARGRSAALAA